MFTLAHLSDPHLPMPSARPLDLLGKRVTGYLNWWRHRVHLHVPEALAAIVADIKAQKPDHIALTGDLVNISLPQEFARASRWLAEFGKPEEITVIPGNHDVYVATRWGEGLGLWGAYMPFGTAMALVGGPLVIAAAGWKGWWWLLAAISAGMALWLALALPRDAA